MGLIKKKALHLLEYGLLRVVVILIGGLPDRCSAAFGRFLGGVAWRVTGIRRRVVLEQLSRAFPDQDDCWRRQVGLECYRHLGEWFTGMFMIPRKPTSWMAERIRIEGRNLLDEALESGRGVINVTFHYGNWELMGAYAARLGYPLDVIMRGQQNRFFSDYVSRLRKASGMRLIPVSQASRLAVRSLRQGRIVTFLADQDAYGNGVFVPFMGRAASTPIGPALYALKTGAPVILSFMVPESSGLWRIVFEKVSRPDTEDRERFIAKMTAFFTSRLEHHVTQRPEYWFWPHRRWKTPPPSGSKPRFS